MLATPFRKMKAKQNSSKGIDFWNTYFVEVRVRDVSREFMCDTLVEDDYYVHERGAFSCSLIVVVLSG